MDNERVLLTWEGMFIVGERRFGFQIENGADDLRVVKASRNYEHSQSCRSVLCERHGGLRSA